MADITLLVLGPVRLVTSDGEPLGRLGAKSKALLAYLASQPDGCAERGQLGQLLWDHGTEAEARHCLRQALLTLRGQLGAYADVVLRSQRDFVQLRLESLDVDLLHFETAARSADDEVLTAASLLWRGPFCQGLDVGADPFEEWLLVERARLDALAAAAFRRVAEAQAAAGRFDLALAAAQRCVALSPFDDAAHSRLISLYRQRGWIGPARAAYRRCVELFQAELGEAPNKMVEEALTGAATHADRPRLDETGFPQQETGGLLRPAPEAGTTYRRRLPALAHDAATAVLSLAVVLAATLVLQLSIGTEGNSPAQKRPQARAWVEIGGLTAYASGNQRGAEWDPAKTSAAENASTIPSSEESPRSAEPNTELAYLYPLGC